MSVVGAESLLTSFISWVVLLIEGLAAILLTLSVGKALFLSFLELLKGNTGEAIRSTRLTLGHWLTLALEFLLAADILKTLVNPSWQELGQLAAIATIRTALNFFLERELHTQEAKSKAPTKQ